MIDSHPSLPPKGEERMGKGGGDGMNKISFILEV
jgi:hypothetical protein